MKVYQGELGEMKAGRIPKLEVDFFAFLTEVIKGKKHNLAVTGREISCIDATEMADNISSGRNAYPDPEKMRRKVLLHMVVCQKGNCPARKFFL